MKHSACTASPICWRPADSRTRALGIVMRATAITRTKSKGSMGSLSASGVPGTRTRLLIGTDSGYGSRLASCAMQPGAMHRRFAHADDAAAAHADAGAAHMRSVSSRSW